MWEMWDVKIPESGKLSFRRESSLWENSEPLSHPRMIDTFFVRVSVIRASLSRSQPE